MPRKPHETAPPPFASAPDAARRRHAAPGRFAGGAFRHLAAFAAALCMGAAGWGCEEGFSNEGKISDDQLNGKTSTQASSTASASSESSSASTATSSSGTSSSSSASSSSSSATATGSYNTSSAIGGIVWKGKNVSGWPVTTTLRASVGGGNIRLNYDKAKVWPSNGGVCANCWAIVNINGTWYAGTFEYLRPGQTSKPTSTLDGSGGDHFKTSPLSSWRPQSGEVFGLMVSGLCRAGLSNVQERSNICVVRWP